MAGENKISLESKAPEGDKQEKVQKEAKTEEVVKEKTKEKTDSEMKKGSKSEDSEMKKGSKSEDSESQAPADYKKKEKKERIAVLSIYTTFNNTIINITDLAGNTIAKFTGGQSTKQNRLKANPTVAMFIAQKVAEEAKDNGITGFYVKIRAGTGQNNPGPGAHAAIKSLTRAGFKIISIMDSTRIARGGPKKKGGRRGRRV